MGGASAAANAAVLDRLFKHHGCWRSELAKDGYVKDLVSSLMSVSESLNLQPILCYPNVLRIIFCWHAQQALRILCMSLIGGVIGA